MNDCRKKFEEWANRKGYDLRCITFDLAVAEYADNETWALWGCWQAASLAMSERVRELEEALYGLMEVERRGRLMPIGREWDAARAALKEKAAGEQS